jgi:predicted alpha-1,2-mannosidase
MSRALGALAFMTLGLCALSSAASSGANATSTQPASMVDPFIGTALSDDDFPGADAPFGMVQWSPDTTPTRPSGGGYAYHDNLINGFSLTHISGPGCAAGGDIPILPTTGTLDKPLQQSIMPSEPYSHSSESGSPGYYSVSTGLTPVRTQLTVTQHSGLASFTYPSTKQANVLVNLGGSAMKVASASGSVIGDNEMTGAVTVGGKGTGFCGANDQYTIYVWLQFSRPFTSFGTWKGSTMTAQSRQASGASSGMYATFDTAGQPVVLLKAGISYVSSANAQLNAETEDPGWDFTTVRSATYNAWNTLLNRVAVSGGTTQNTTVFYTALYHSLLDPSVFSDVNGQYMGFDDKVHTVPSGHAQYANFSGWDIYRSQIQLLTLVDPSVASDIATSMLNEYAQSGQLPKWALNNGESYIMVGDPADPILADLHAFGATFNTTQALADMVAEASTPTNVRPGLTYDQTLHYLPSDGTYGCCDYYGSVSTTLEYATADQSIAQLAESLGDTSVTSSFMAQAQNWEYLLNPATGFIEPKSTNGQFQSAYLPLNPNNYVEANGYEYSADVPFNLAGLIAADGGDTAYNNYLNVMFLEMIGPDSPLAQSYDFGISVDDIGIAYASPFAWIGDEPSVEIPWEFDYTGRPYETQGLVRKITQSLYTTSSNGIPGNDDLGEMSSWLVWADLGLYPETPGTSTLDLGSPLFPHAQLDLPSGKTLTINAPGASATTPYVQSAQFNGQSWNDDYLPAQTITGGGVLDVALGRAPNKGWASVPADAPPSWSFGEIPAIGFTSGPEVPSLGLGAPVSVGAQNITGQAQAIAWTANATPGITLSSSSGRWNLGPDGRGSTALTITASPSTTGTVTFTLRTATGQVLPPVVVSVAPLTTEAIGAVTSQDITQAAGL